MIDNKMHNNVSNSSLNNVINLIQNILQENRNNRTKTSDNNSLNIFADFNKELSNDYQVNTSSPVKNNNNNFYSNVHIKTITNIKELISNNMNNNNTTSSNNSNNNTYNLKNSNSLTFQNNMSFDNSNNEPDQSSKSILKTNITKKRNSKIKKLSNSNRTLNKMENHNNSYYKLGKNKYNINNFLTTRKFYNPNENNIKKVSTENANNNNNKNNNNNNNSEKKRRISIKSGNSKRMSLKSYIKKVKNLYILKKLSNNKKREMKNANRNISANNISMGDDDIKENNKKELNNISVAVYKGREIEDDNNIRNDSDKKDKDKNKDNLTSNNKAVNLKSNNKDNSENTQKKEVTIKDHKENKDKKDDNSTSSAGGHRNRQKSIHSRTGKSNKKNNANSQTDNTQNNQTNISKKSNHTSKPFSKRNSNKNFDTMSPREKSYYLLSLSPILRLTERLFFGRATQNLRKVQTVKSIMEKNETFLKDKVKELEEKLVECEKKIITPFNASKTAEIAFNFILTKDEDEFKTYILFTNNEEEKKEYYNYTKIIYLLFDEDYENIDGKDLNENLYDLIEKKGFESIKDYLYYIFIKKKENIDVICKMDKINGLLAQSPELVKRQFDVKFCRFVLFTSFLINEIIHYGNDVKNAIELKVKTREYLDIVLKKLELYKISQK